MKDVAATRRELETKIERQAEQIRHMARRIRNQRQQLHEHWSIVEQRAGWPEHFRPPGSKYLQAWLRTSGENMRLRRQIEQMTWLHQFVGSVTKIITFTPAVGG